VLRRKDADSAKAPTKSAAHQNGAWSRGRWIGLIAAFFIFQLGFLYLVMDRPLSGSTLRGPRITARLVPGTLTEERMSQAVFASDPLLFPLASQHGFSGAGWMTVYRPDYAFPAEIEPPQWLALKTDSLGRVAPAEPKSELPFELGQRSTPQTEALPVFVPAVLPQTNTIVRVDAKLSERAAGLPLKLPAWPSTKVLSNSVVDVAVNGAGHVIACRLAAPSDSKEADHAALEKAKLLKFRPLNAVGTIWGQAIFDWATAEPKEGKGK
jgi:hypothetical protein